MLTCDSSASRSPGLRSTAFAFITACPSTVGTTRKSITVHLVDSSTGNRWQPPTDSARDHTSVRTRDEREAMVDLSARALPARGARNPDCGVQQLSGGILVAAARFRAPRTIVAARRLCVVVPVSSAAAHSG